MASDALSLVSAFLSIHFQLSIFSFFMPWTSCIFHGLNHSVHFVDSNHCHMLFPQAGMLFPPILAWLTPILSSTSQPEPLFLN